MGPLIPVALSVLPALAEWLGGARAGDVAERAAGVVRAVTGTDDPAAAAAVLQDPAKHAEMQIRLAEIAGQERDAYLADMASARARDVALQSDGKRNVRADVMVALCVLGILAGVGFLTTGLIPSGSDVAGAVIGLIGLFSKCFADAFQFEFGSSRGSADRAKTQDALLTQTTTALNDASLQAARSQR